MQSGFARLEDERVDQLPQVVGRDVGGHAHGDARGAVGQQVREARRQHHRLHHAAVEVGHEVDRLAVDVAQHLLGDRVEPRLGVAVGGGGVAVDRAEVALAVDQRVAEREVLGHAHHRVVDRRVAVRVVVLQHLAHDAGATSSSRVRREPLLLHRVEDAAVHRLEAVAHVGQRAADDDRHRVVEERAADLVLDVHRRCVSVPGGSGGRVPLGRSGSDRALEGPSDIASRPQMSRFCTSRALLLDEVVALPPRLDVVAHQRGEGLVGLDGVVDAHLEQRALLGVHGGVGQLVGVHLAEALVALDGEALLAEGEQALEQRHVALDALRLVAATLHREGRRADGVHRRGQLEQALVVGRADELGVERRHELDAGAARRGHEALAAVLGIVLRRPGDRLARGLVDLDARRERRADAVA